MAIDMISRRSFCLCAVLFLVVVSANFVQSQFPESAKLIQNPCNSKQTCHDCIQAKDCAWCLQPDIGDKPRCFYSKSPLLSGSCPEEYTYNPKNDEKVLVNKALSRGRSQEDQVNLSTGSGQSSASGQYWSSSQTESYSTSDFSQEGWTQQRQIYGDQSHQTSGKKVSYGSYTESGEIVQIYPQRVSLKLRINEAHRLKVQYAQAEDYPIDLYYLMDLSKSMEDDKNKLSLLGDTLSQTMQKITSNFRLGFGSFVDKVLMPYVSTIPRMLEHPCDQCEAPYGYKNHMSLSTDTQKFTTNVKSASVSGNRDAPEGGLDAIMQAVVCRKEIGWREQARRLLVFSTDARFHYAGDGKLGGVIAPNDGECHMSESGEYTHSQVLDYPSISHINLKVKENSINVIFAVTAQQVGVYEKLSKHIEGSTIALLSNDSSNVVELVKEQYDKIRSSVEMKDTASSAIKVTYYSSCLGSGPLTQTSKCDGLKVSDTVNFEAEIVVTECPQNPNEWKQTFQIYSVGINESLTVDLEMLCSCECENQQIPSVLDEPPKCNGHGAYKCGICECDGLHFGRNCECSIADVHTQSERDRSCRPDNTTLTDCSGKGHCVCGVCECEKRTNAEEMISGKYCECDNFSCERDRGLLCGGPDHGVCECGRCTCQKGWIGDDCTCRDSNDTCKPPNGGEICSGHGDCVCGACKCEETSEGRYSGKFCEKCPTCSGRCHEFKECVQCQQYKTGPMGDKPELCAKNCSLFAPVGVDVLQVNEEAGDHLCIFYDENDCRFEFVYNDSENIKVKAKEKLECPTEIFILGIVMGVIASIVLIGLAFLFLWKILTTIHDRREFAKFEKERRSAKWDTGENPIYKQATSTFKNPTYNGGR